MSEDEMVTSLTARLAEREALALSLQAALDAGWNYFDEPGDYDADGMLRDVAAKRAILAEYERLRGSYAAYPNAVNAASFAAVQSVIRLLAGASGG